MQDYLTSYLNVSQYPAHADKKNNWVITESEEKDGKTILEFNRKRVTDDIMTNAVPAKGDIALTVRVMMIMEMILMMLIMILMRMAIRMMMTMLGF